MNNQEANAGNQNDLSTYLGHGPEDVMWPGCEVVEEIHLPIVASSSLLSHNLYLPQSPRQVGTELA
jgi:hypothetical protein